MAGLDIIANQSNPCATAAVCLGQAADVAVTAQAVVAVTTGTILVHVTGLAVGPIRLTHLALAVVVRAATAILGCAIDLATDGTLLTALSTATTGVGATALGSALLTNAIHTSATFEARVAGALLPAA